MPQIRLCYFALQVIVTLAHPDALGKDEAQKLTDLGVIPEIIHDPPPYAVNVTWDTGVSANFGNEISTEMIVNLPYFNYPHNETDFYSVHITDFDDNVNWEPIFQEWQLLWVANVPANRVHQGEVMIPYETPHIANASHRIAVTVFRQEGKQNLTALKLYKPPPYIVAVLQISYEMQTSLLAANVFKAFKPSTDITKAFRSTKLPYTHQYGFHPPS